MRKRLVLVLLLVAVFSGMPGCSSYPKDKPVSDIWIGATLDEVKAAETDLEETTDEEKGLIVLKGNREYCGVSGVFTISVNSETEKVSQLEWRCQASLRLANAKQITTKFAEIKQAMTKVFGKPSFEWTDRPADAIPKELCLWDVDGYVISLEQKYSWDFQYDYVYQVTAAEE